MTESILKKYVRPGIAVILSCSILAGCYEREPIYDEAGEDNPIPLTSSMKSWDDAAVDIEIN